MAKRSEWTIQEIAQYLGISYNAAYKAVRRWRIEATSREPGREGGNLYPAASVKHAAKNAPGRGFRSDLKNTTP